MPVCLVPLEKGRSIVVDKAIVFIGRDASCDVVLTRSRRISRKHCCLAQVNNRLVIRDLGSMNGVRVNGERVRGVAGLEIGDEVWIGDLKYRLDEITSATPKKREAQEEQVAENREDKRAQRPGPDNLSQDVPIAIPDESESFLIEPSIHKPSAPDPINHVLPVDWDENKVILLDKNPEQNDRLDDSDDVLPVSDNDEYNDSGSQVEVLPD